MSYFEKILKDVEIVSAYIGKKAKDSIDVVKHNKELFKEGRKLDALYQELGKLSYEIHTGDTKNVHSINDLCNQIEEQSKFINQLKQEVDTIEYEVEEVEAINEKVRHEENKYMTIKKDIPKPQAGSNGILLLKFCPNCQIGNNPDAKECISCGEKF